MALTIHDEATLDTMALVEYPDREPHKNETKEAVQKTLKTLRERWKKEQLDPKRPDSYRYSWLGAKQQHKKLHEELTAEEARLYTGAIHVIYGVGGWHRYMVTMDGVVHFSHHHSNPEARERATTLGFEPW
jgi:hypothetical protein